MYYYLFSGRPTGGGALW